MNTCTIAICTTVKNMPTPYTICPHKWDFARQIHPDRTTCDECDIECFNHCGEKFACPCCKVEVVKPEKGQVFGLTKPGLYIQLRGINYAKIDNIIRIRG